MKNRIAVAAASSLVFVSFVTGAADAQTDDGHHFQVMARSASGLGQAAPIAPDVSSSPNWHVYFFQRDGVNYYQVTDLLGGIRVAIAAGNGSFLIMPMGTDQSLLSIVSGPIEGAELLYAGQGVELSRLGNRFYARAIPVSGPTTSQPNAALLQCGGTDPDDGHHIVCN
jgi:hypothetical protein